MTEMEVEAKENASAATPCGLSSGVLATVVDGCTYCADNGLFSGNAITSESTEGTLQTTTKVVFLTVNDVYELFPDVNGVGGIAELATMLKSIKKRIAHDAHVIVTLNGDFLWRSELDRKDKGSVMVDILNNIGIEYAVVGNHEFDFGAEHLRDLLAGAKFTCFGSNVRASSSRELYPGLVDTHIIPLSNGIKLGMFGVVTTVTGKDPFAGPSVVFDDERPHAQRCVEHLQAQGVNAIVALTHFKVADDIRLAMQVPGINLILGGHDHFPVTCVAGADTLIHKSGMDALWLGAVEVTLTTPTASHSPDQVANVQVGFQWQMLLNRGYHAHPACLAILNKYISDVEQEELAKGKLEPLGTALTALDGRRITCRTQESNMGNLVADALREGLDADVGLVNAGYIKGDKLNDPGLIITRTWLEKYLPLMKPTVVVEVSLRELKNALTYWLRRYPAMSSSQPHFSGIRIIYDVTKATTPVISSIRLCKENYEARDETSASARGEESEEQEEEEMDRLVSVGVPLASSLDGWHFFDSARQLRSGPLVRDLVEKFVIQRRQVDYPPKEDRLRVIEPALPQQMAHKASAL
ncbi:5'-nucleotidase C-terminal domain [Phytophthora infestans]|uniref:5'-nucleotidase C-terminal domain n=1 Tax=Phytophthora infestans TaxID=4787 RepID=A0A833W262_PHYIN|nr:5'-nucleotidase C-terminal domain [Phytophthora infestans]